MLPNLVLCVFLVSICYCVRVYSSLDGSIPPHREAHIRLKEKILSHRATKFKLSPTQNGHLNVSLVFYPIQILRIDEVEQSVSSINYVDMTWVDKDLAWNRSKYGDISLIALGYDELWHPNLVVKNSVSKYEIASQEGADRLLLSDTGHVTLKTAIFLKTLCNFDFTYFPFDLQSCEIDIVSAKDDCRVQLNAINIKYPPEPVVLKGEWTIADRQTESGGLDSFEGIVYYARIKVVLRRSSLFYIVFVIVPMAASSLMTSLVFRIPPCCEQKVSFLVTLFVSNAVFLDFIAATVPRSVNVMPRVMLFQIFLMLQCFLALVASLFVIGRHKQEVLSTNQIKNNAIRKTQEKFADESITIGGRNYPEKTLAAIQDEKKKTIESDPNQSDSEIFKLEMFSLEIQKHHEKTKVDQDRTKIRLLECVRHVSADRLDFIFFWLFNFASLPFYVELFLQLD